MAADGVEKEFRGKGQFGQLRNENDVREKGREREERRGEPNDGTIWKVNGQFPSDGATETPGES